MPFDAQAVEGEDDGRRGFARAAGEAPTAARRTLRGGPLEPCTRRSRPVIPLVRVLAVHFHPNTSQEDPMRKRVLRLTLLVTLAALAGAAQPSVTPEVGPYPCPPPCRMQ